MKQIFFLCIAVSLCACRGRQSSAPVGQGDTVRFSYARLLTLVRHEGYTEATLQNPWKPGMVLHRYVLVPKDSELPDPLPQGTLVRTPLSRSMIFTTVHCAMLQSLHREQAISGVADLKYIKLPWIQQQVSEGRIADVGDGLSPVIEKIIDCHPDAILLSPFENSGGYGKTEELGIPIIECAEYMETSPLARAEWLRFYGLLFGCEIEADSLFALVDSSYHALKAQAARLPSHPLTLMDKVTGSVWYVPGGQSTLGQMVKDAGGRYPWAADSHSGSLSLPFEAVLERAGEADVWFFRYSGQHDITLPELLAEHHGYPQFRAVSQQRVFACDVDRTLFYEETPFRPDLLLRDFILMLHPEQAAQDSLRYYRPVR